MTNEELVEAIQSGNNVKDNMALLWELNKGTIYRVVEKYRALEDVEDLMQQGYIGLYHAATHYDVGLGVPFVNYFPIWIKRSILKYINECGGLVRVSSGLIGLVSNYGELLSFMLANYGRTPTDEEATKCLNISYERLGQLKNAMNAQSIKSLNAPISTDGDETELMELVQSEEDVEADALGHVELEELGSLLWGMVGRLPQEQAQIIRKRYIHNMTIKDISTATGRRETEIRTAETKALKTLRHTKGSSRLSDYAYERGLKGCGIENFQRTWTSSTERTALELYQQ